MYRFLSASLLKTEMRIIMYTPDENRYEKMIYTHCGKSGLRLPKISLGFWQNFGYQSYFANMEEMVHTAFDLGINHFDLANNFTCNCFIFDLSSNEEARSDKARRYETGFVVRTRNF